MNWGFKMAHVPVLLKETIEVLKPSPGEFFIDGTLGNGGHAREILKNIKPSGTFLGIDWDKNVIEKIQPNLKENKVKVLLVNDNFKNIPVILDEFNLGRADGFILDLGFSSDQIEDSGRGFSFSRDEPLIMTYDSERKPAYEWLRKLNQEKLAEIIGKLGGERFADRIARAIKSKLPKTSKDLSDLIFKILPRNYQRGRIHPATRTFLALRIFVNDEIVNLEKILVQIPKIMKVNGRVAIISFNSLEDRLVKIHFRTLVKNGLAENLIKKIIAPTDFEVAQNPSARSAKLRAIKIL